MQRPTTRLTAGTALALLPLAACAHPGHQLGYSFSTGFVHPFTGLDHLLAMLAVGFAAARMGRRGLWLPLAFMGFMVMGAAAGVAGLAVPGVETGIALSVLALGLMQMLAPRLSTGLGVALTGLFAVFHGLAHGAEMPPHAHAVTFFAGFTLATGALHLGGMALGRLATQPRLRWVAAVAGVGTGGVGALMLLGLA